MTRSSGQMSRSAQWPGTCYPRVVEASNGRLVTDGRADHPCDAVPYAAPDPDHRLQRLERRGGIGDDGPPVPGHHVQRPEARGDRPGRVLPLRALAADVAVQGATGDPPGERLPGPRVHRLPTA